MNYSESVNRLPAYVKSLLLSSCLCTVGNLSADEPAAVSIPFGSEDVVLDGILSAEEWGDAALLQQFKVLGKDSNQVLTLDQSTVARVKYIDEFLYIAFDCEEDEAGYPEAYNRPQRGNLTEDDAVQVVVGLVDPTVLVREDIDVGGYKGAMGTRGAAADHYYQFTVNAAGVTARSYNEFQLRNSLFEAAVSQHENGWSAELKIPMSSFGITEQDYPNIFFNLFRVRPPETATWHMTGSGYGGYRPMEFGVATLLDKSKSNQKTVELPLEASISLSDESISESLSVKIGYYPLSGFIVGELDGVDSGLADEAVLSVSGFSEVKVSVAATEEFQYVYQEVSPGSQPEREASLTLYKNGHIVQTVTRSLEAVEAPEWLGTEVAMEYVDHKIPQPWTQPVIEGKMVQLVDKQIRFGAYGLFESILHEGVEIQAGPAEIDLEVSGQPVLLESQAPSLQVDGTAVAVQTLARAKSVQLKTRSQLDYDGFTIVKMKLEGVDPKDVSKLSVRIPIRPEVAKYVHEILVQKDMELDGFGYAASASPLWTGNEDRGLSFNYDTELFYSEDIRHQVRLIEEESCVWMEFNFVDNLGQLPEEMPIFRFFLQPTPTKPLFAERVRPKVQQYKWELWSDYQGYPDLEKIPELTEWASKNHEGGRITQLYGCQGLQDNSPPMTVPAIREDLLMQPEWLFYRRKHDPGKGVPGFATCKRGPEGDLQLWGWYKLANEAGIDGILSDGTSPAWNCENPAHTGCRRPYSLSMDEIYQSRVVGTRSFLKRLRGIFNDTGRPLFMSAHTGGGIDINTLSFFDGYLEGEQLSRFPRDYQIPLPVYAVGYSGRPWGFNSEFWVKRWIWNKGPYLALNYALLFNNEVRGNFLVQAILADFDTNESTEFHPYWRDQAQVDFKSGLDSTKMSYYLNDKSALVVVSNISAEPDSFSLGIENLFPEIDVDTVVDVLTGEVYGVNDGRLKAKIAANRCYAFRIDQDEALAAAGSVAVSTSRVNTAAPWALSGGTHGVSLTSIEHEQGTDKVGYLLKSSLKKDEARLTFTGAEFYEQGSLGFGLKVQQRVKFYFGEASVIYYKHRGWTIDGFVPGRGELFQAPVRVNQGSQYVEVCMNDGSVDIVFNGYPLARGLKLDTASAVSFSIATWGADSVALYPDYVSSKSHDIIVGRLETTRALSTGHDVKYQLRNLSSSAWSANVDAPGVSLASSQISGEESIRLASTVGRAKATATLHEHRFGDRGTIVLRFKMGDRLEFSVGDIRIRYSSRWTVTGPRDGWSSGYVNQVPYVPGELCTMEISFNEGGMNATLNGYVFIRDIQFRMAPINNVLKVSTWGGDDVEFNVVEFSSEPRELFPATEKRHPVVSDL
ncbi:glycoside hydrolase domain-containing protein [Thalassobacterium sedimentorum]|nr:glycoside hydrolase domain-containing protein [Coraliomargarita sp. SDUM461004]